MNGRIPQEFIDEVIGRVNIVDVVREAGVVLKKAGREYKALCPFHDERNPSFTVSEAKQFVHCFGCGENGNAIGFLMRHDGLGFRETIELLAERVGLQVPRDANLERAHQERLRLAAVLEAATEWFEHELARDARSRRYLDRCRIDVEFAQRYAVGAVTRQTWSQLFKDLDQQALLDAGLARLDTDSGEICAPLGDALMLPVRDRRRRTLGFIAQQLPGVKDTPQVARPLDDSALFKAEREVFGLYEATPQAEDLNGYVVVESAMEVLFLAQRDICNVVAPARFPATAKALAPLVASASNLLLVHTSAPDRKPEVTRSIDHVLDALSDGADASFAFLPKTHRSSAGFVQAHGVAAYLALEDKAIPVIDLLHRKIVAEPQARGEKGDEWARAQGRIAIERIPSVPYAALATIRFDELMDERVPAGAAVRARSGGLGSTTPTDISTPDASQGPVASNAPPTPTENVRVASGDDGIDAVSVDGPRQDYGVRMPRAAVAEPSIPARAPSLAAAREGGETETSDDRTPTTLSAGVTRLGASDPSRARSTQRETRRLAERLARRGEAQSAGDAQEHRSARTQEAVSAHETPSSSAPEAASGASGAETSEDERIDWVERLLESGLLAERIARAGRTAPKPAVMRAFLGALARHDGRAGTQMLVRAVGVPAYRLPGLVSGMRKVLNIAGTPLLTLEEGTDTVVLDIRQTRKVMLDDG